MARTRVREIAEAQGWNASRLARKADVSYTAMYGIWHGTTEDPGIQTLAKLARALGVPTSDLITDEDPASPEGKIIAPVAVAA